MSRLSYGRASAGLIALAIAGAPAGAQSIARAPAAASTDADQPQPPETRAERRARRAAERRAKRERARDSAATAQSDGADASDIVVTGIRGSVASARNRKRNAKQIVDSVVSEDVGKLPDNNVPEALARVPGVQIDRARGEGQGVTIRGLSDVQTTLNGADVGSAGSRSISLADIPAELLKSVEVYKTRSASQIEGGIAGTVNVELRRPLDFSKGLTLAGSERVVFGEIGNTRSPYFSGLLGYRFETGLGEMGFLANVSYTENRYNENYVVNESPNNVPGASDDPTRQSRAYASLPANLRDVLIVPYAINYGVERGTVKRPSISLAYQWRPSDHLNFVLEGTYFSRSEGGDRSRLNVVTNDASNIIGNVTANPDGTVKTIGFYQLRGTRRILNGGPISQFINDDSDNYHTNFETHWTGGIAQLDFTAQYDWSKQSQYYVNLNARLRNPVSAQVDFNSPNVPGGGPFVTFPGVDIADPTQLNLFQIHDERFKQDSNRFATTLDLTLDTSETGLLRSFQTGYRYTRDNRDNRYGYRDAIFADPATQPTLATVSAATGLPLRTTTPYVRGGSGSTPTWVNLDAKAATGNFTALREFALANDVDTLGNDFSTDRADFQELGAFYDQREESFAAYAQANYAFDLLVPIDGFAGLRYVNTWGNSTSTSYRYQLGSDGSILKDSNGKSVFNVLTQDVAARGNYADLLPSASLIAHFTPKLQLRLAFTRNVQRPEFTDLRPFQELRDAIASPTGVVHAGNPDLGPVVDRNYSASLEYYFGRAGQLTFAPFLKKQTGFIYETVQLEFVPQIGRIAQVAKPRNAGPGQVAGFEASAMTFFDFLGGFARNFGVSANVTYIPSSRLQLYPPDEAPEVRGVFDSPDTSRVSGNVQLYYDTPVLSSRIAYNFRSRYKTGIDYTNPGYSIYTEPTSRLDAAINLTPVKFATFSVEATNILRNNTKQVYGAYGLLPVGVRVQARTIQASIRVRM